MTHRVERAGVGGDCSADLTPVRAMEEGKKRIG